MREVTERINRGFRGSIGLEGTKVIRSRKASIKDVKAVMKRLSDISEIELQNIPLSVDEARLTMIDELKSADGITILDRSTPIAVLLFSKIDEEIYDTMFMAAIGFFDGRSEPTRFLRKYIDAWLNSHPGATLRSTTFSQHPQLHRWYKIMGYSDPQLIGSATIFSRRAC